MARDVVTRRVIAIAVVALAGGCFAPSYDATHCGPAQACPPGMQCTSMGLCAVCGDGVERNGEACDDGNQRDDDDCVGCQLARCGDRVTRSNPANAADREACDTGGASATCDQDCSVVECGDEIVNAAAGEVCADGNTESGDGCSADCRSGERCGNEIEDFDEVCDDGNSESGDGCSANCRSDERCGNGVLDPVGNGSTNPPELCDDGNLIDGDACRSDCQGASRCDCGDGVLGFTEACDDGNAVNTDACVFCRDARCGDGVTLTTGPSPEECDDGNASDDDNCTTSCRLAVCGDGFIDGAPPGLETCDDGNTLDGDACPADCTSP